MNNQTEMLKRKEEWENLYNTLLMQHESLPSEIHKHWNNEAMKCIDEALMKLEKELSIVIETPEVEEEQEEDQTFEYRRYEPVITGKCEVIDGTIIVLYEQNDTGFWEFVGRFNFENNVGYYYTIEGEMKQVQRYSAITRYFNKIDPYASHPSTTIINQIKKQVRKNRREEKKEVA